VRSSWALLPDGSGAGQRRSLQPTVPRSHDERCPSGSGWDSALSWPPERVAASRAPATKVDRLLARETSTGARPRVGCGFGLVRQRLSAGRKARGEPARRRRPCLVRGLRLTSEASAWLVSPARRLRESNAVEWSERRARARAGCARCTGDGARAVRRSCSRVVLVAEVDERRLVQTERSWV